MIRRAIPVLAAALLLAAALTLVVLIGLQSRDDDARSARRARAVEVAEQAVTGLTTVSPGTVEDDTAGVLAVAGGGFHDRFAERAAPYAEAVRAAGASAVGTVVAAGVDTDTDTDTGAGPRATTVLVAATQEVTSADEDGPPVTQSLTFRFRVTVADGPDGPVVSRMEFVR